jgi:predicted N-acyltransferase
LTKTIKVYKRFADALPEWKQILPEGHHLIKNDLLAIENSSPPDITIYYVSLYADSVLTGVMYLQHLEFSKKHFSKDLIKSPLLKFFSPFLSLLKAPILVCGNLFRVNFQSFYFKEKNDRKLVFDYLKVFKKQMRKQISFSGILVKDCKREFEQNSYDCFKFAPFHQDLTMEMMVHDQWNNFEDYVNALSKKYRQRAVKIRKSIAGVEKKLLTFDEIIYYQKDIEHLYFNVVNKQPMALGLLGSEYFIQMKQQLKDEFELMAFIKDGQLLAFSGHIYYPEKKAMELHYIGFDYEQNHAYNLYFNIIFAGIETAINKRYRTLEMGRTAREAKASAGAKAVENFNYIWVKAGLPRLAVNYFSEKFSNQMGEEWQNRNPLK